MSIQGVFEAALLKYILAEVDQRADGIYSVDQYAGRCHCSDDDWTCMCDTDTRLTVVFTVPREVDRSGRSTWLFYGNFFDLINMLDRTDGEADDQ